MLHLQQTPNRGPELAEGRTAWDDFRQTSWLETIDYPTITLQQTQQLLALPY